MSNTNLPADLKVYKQELETLNKRFGKDKVTDVFGRHLPNLTDLTLEVTLNKLKNWGCPNLASSFGIGWLLGHLDTTTA